MSPTNHLVVFAKAPKMGAVKQRLSAGIGPVEATAFYRRTTAALLRRLSQDPRWRSVLAATPDSAARNPTLWKGLAAPGVRRLAQGPGDLGQRMARVFRCLAPGPAVIIGTDIPDIRPWHIASAFAALGHHDAVFGPALDGGYWLVGLRRRPTVPDIFSGVRWSTEHALADTLNNLGKNHRVKMLEKLRDIDEARDYAAWRRRSAA